MKIKARIIDVERNNENSFDSKEVEIEIAPEELSRAIDEEMAREKNIIKNLIKKNIKILDDIFGDI